MVGRIIYTFRCCRRRCCTWPYCWFSNWQGLGRRRGCEYRHRRRPCGVLGNRLHRSRSREQFRRGRNWCSRGYCISSCSDKEGFDARAEGGGGGRNWIRVSAKGRRGSHAESYFPAQIDLTGGKAVVFSESANSSVVSCSKWFKRFPASYRPQS